MLYHCILEDLQTLYHRLGDVKTEPLKKKREEISYRKNPTITLTPMNGAPTNAYNGKGGGAKPLCYLTESFHNKVKILQVVL